MNETTSFRSPSAFPASTVGPDELRQRTLHRRAVEAVIWGIPAVDSDLMLQAAIHAGAGPNQMTYWSGLFGWKNQTLTPNPDAIYFVPSWIFVFEGG